MKRLCGTYWSWNKWINHLGSRRRTGVLLGPCFSHKYPSQLQASETPEALPRATGWSKIYMLAVEYNSEPHKERERKRKKKENAYNRATDRCQKISCCVSRSPPALEVNCLATRSTFSLLLFLPQPHSLFLLFVGCRPSPVPPHPAAQAAVGDCVRTVQSPAAARRRPGRRACARRGGRGRVVVRAVESYHPGLLG
jgi:hypothetical protein